MLSGSSASRLPEIVIRANPARSQSQTEIAGRIAGNMISLIRNRSPVAAPNIIVRGTINVELTKYWMGGIVAEQHEGQEVENFILIERVQQSRRHGGNRRQVFRLQLADIDSGGLAGTIQIRSDGQSLLASRHHPP